MVLNRYLWGVYNSFGEFGKKIGVETKKVEQTKT